MSGYISSKELNRFHQNVIWVGDVLKEINWNYLSGTGEHKDDEHKFIKHSFWKQKNAWKRMVTVYHLYGG